MSDNPAGSEPPEPAANRHLNFAPRWAVIGIFLIMLVGSAAYARSFLMPVVLAVLLQLVFAPVRRKLARWGIAPGIAAGLIVTTLLSLLLAGAISLSGPVKTWVDRAPMIGFEIREKMDDLREVTEGVQKAAQQVDEITSPREQEEEPGVQRVRVEEDTGLLAYALSLPWVIAQIVFTLILMFFLLASVDC